MKKSKLFNKIIDIANKLHICGLMDINNLVTTLRVVTSINVVRRSIEKTMYIYTHFLGHASIKQPYIFFVVFSSHHEKLFSDARIFD